MKYKLYTIYGKLYKALGPQGWWPGETPFEVMVGAILTQNTNWQNVSRAIANLKKANLLSAPKLYALKQNRLASLIRPAGYYNIKAKRLKNFLDYLFKHYNGSITALRKKQTRRLRQELLSVNGVGEETADSILLYALDKPVFVVDAYTKRILSRHKFIRHDAPYSSVQKLFSDNLPRSVKMFNEYHALLVRAGKDFCRKQNPRCRICPLKNGDSKL